MDLFLLKLGKSGALAFAYTFFEVSFDGALKFLGCVKGLTVLSSRPDYFIISRRPLLMSKLTCLGAIMAWWL